MKHEDIKVINVDNRPFVVDELPTEIKNLVEVFNHWRQEGVEYKSKHMMAEAALRDLQREIVTAIRVHEEKNKDNEAEQENPQEKPQESSNEA